MQDLDLGKIILTVGDWSPEGWLERLKDHLPADDIIPTDGKAPPDPAIVDQVKYVVAWHTPEGYFSQFPNLKAALSTGAGVDHLVHRTDLPADIPILRVVDPDLTGRVTAWTVMNVIAHHRQALGYLESQKAASWQALPQSSAPDVRVGIMGFGALGQSVANALQPLGYQLSAWARTKRQASIPLYAGMDELDTFLSGTDILICLLPLTPQTREILNAETFAKLPQDGVTGPFVINGGRGGHQNEADLLAALHNGTLKGASIDVFQQEPLPSDSPLWSAPNILITPHTAGVSEPQALVDNMIANLRAFERGEPVDVLVDRQAGY